MLRICAGGCDTVDVRYMLGSQVESMAFTNAGAEFEPAGVTHAVDTGMDAYLPDAVLGYAVCGAAVRVWPDRPFDPDSGDAHDQCVAIARNNPYPSDDSTAQQNEPMR